MKKIYLVYYWTKLEEEIEAGYFSTREEANKCADAIKQYLGSSGEAKDIGVISIQIQEKFDFSTFKKLHNIE